MMGSLELAAYIILGGTGLMLLTHVACGLIAYWGTWRRKVEEED